MVVDSVTYLRAGDNASIMSGRDNALPAQPGKMRFQLIAQVFIGVRVRKEKGRHRDSLPEIFAWWSAVYQNGSYDGSLD